MQTLQHIFTQIFTDSSLSLEGLSLTKGALGALSIASAYVGILYLLPSQERNNPRTIRQRTLAVSGVAVGSTLAVYALTHHSGIIGVGRSLPDIVGMGSLHGVLACLGLSMLLFAGPLVQGIFVARSLHLPDCDLMTLRNLIVAPVTEEIVFRGCIYALLRPALGGARAVLVSPLFFGVAHLHHLWQGQALAPTLFQFAYTTVFGWLTTFYLHRTGSVAGPIAAHIFCNYMGMFDAEEAFQGKHRAVLIPAYVAGLVGFALLLNPVLTEF